MWAFLTRKRPHFNYFPTEIDVTHCSNAFWQLSPINKDTEINLLLKAALTNQVNAREVYIKGADASYHYEGYKTNKTSEISDS